MPDGAEWDYWKTAFVNGEGAFIAYDAYASSNEFKDMKDEYGFVCFPMGSNATDYCNVYKDNPYAIPGCYDADKAWKIAFAFNLYEGPCLDLKITMVQQIHTITSCVIQSL